MTIEISLTILDLFIILAWIGTAGYIWGFMQSFGKDTGTWMRRRRQA